MSVLQDVQDRNAVIENLQHNLRTPLISIKGFAQLLQLEEVITDTAKTKKYIDIINRNSEKMHTAILELEQALYDLYVRGDFIE